MWVGHVRAFIGGRAPQIGSGQNGPVTSLLHRVILIRHGETEWNRVRRRQGQLDSPLTAAGRSQAMEAASLCGGLGIDHIFTSPLGRARETAAIVSSVLQQPVTVVNDLTEVHHGDFAGLTNNEIEGRHPGELVRRRQDLYRWTFPSGESYADADVRAARALQHVRQPGLVTPLIVAHEMIGRMLLRSLLDLDVDDALALTLPHGTVFEVELGERRLTRHSADGGFDSDGTDDGVHVEGRR